MSIITSILIILLFAISTVCAQIQDQCIDPTDDMVRLCPYIAYKVKNRPFKPMESFNDAIIYSMIMKTTIYDYRFYDMICAIQYPKCINNGTELPLCKSMCNSYMNFCINFKMVDDGKEDCTLYKSSSSSSSANSKYSGLMLLITCACFVVAFTLL